MCMLLSMTIEDQYRRDLNEAQKHLDDLLRQREKLEVLIAKQKRRISALAELCEDERSTIQPAIVELGGLTEACITALRASHKDGISVAEIQNTLKELGFPLKEYKAPLASITTTVNRLVESGVVKTFRVSGGGKEYKWVGPSYGASRSLANQIVDAERERSIKKP